MRFIDFFAGIGGFRRGLELSGHKCVGFCEWDRFATASYTSMHLLNEDQRKKLEKMTLKQRQKEILKDDYRNGEWYANDIRNVEARDIPRSECWCFGAPCQDFSVAGKRAGLNGDRSSLVREIFRLLEEQEEESRPEWLIYENVKGMFSSNRGLDYLSILSELDRLGYDVEWQIINSKWWVPQNRERVYTIGHLRRCGSSKVLPVKGTGGKNCLLQMIPGGQGQRVYDVHGLSSTLSSQGGGQGAKTGLYAIPVTPPEREKCNYSVKAICNTNPSGHGMNGNVYDSNGLSPSLTTNKGEGDKILIEIKEATKKGYAEASEGDSINFSVPESKTRRGRVGKQIAQTLDTGCNQGVIVKPPIGYSVYALWYEKYQTYIAIRKLIPKECFRLQGWSDDYYEKAAFVNSDSQLYKQAGNGVTVDVVAAIGEKIYEIERMV